MAASSRSPALPAAMWMSGSLFSFLTVAIAARELTRDMSVFEVLFFRSLVALVILLPLVLRNGGAGMRTGQFGRQLTRNIVHFAGQYLWVVGIALLPLAQVFALEFTMPIWLTLLAALFLGEAVTRTRALTVLLGFIGVLIILRPGVEEVNPAAFLVIAAAISFAVSVLMTKVLTRTDTALTIVFYMTVLQMPMGLVPALFDWTAPRLADLPWIAAVGIAGLTAHYCLARALEIADASLIVPMDFLRVPLVAVAGFALYGEPLSAWVLAGAAIIFAANYNLILNESRRPAQPSRR